ncbi:iron-containing alcohol dehydrogenase [Salidesulfovibrio onnuriiensis]|uniref:iron-containing alcohol dehydrogenase n=1 Tax=Salidesulfovibrio onnuriiensis TaxID=2583823 RepID=UPI0011CA0711|nr:iron-containing alcohol dehydrogenase [Salidesulfovibrio onnuriiensis]
MLITKFAVPDIIFGNGSIRHLAQCARRVGASRVLLVSDKGLHETVWVNKVREILDEDGLECVYFNNVNSNPRDHQIHEGAEIYRREGCDVLVSLGGGSPMDATKGIGILAGNGGKIADYEGANRIMRPLPPMILIPSTAGSGSDISQFCIITDVRREVKMSIISRSLVPNISIIDPMLLSTKSESLIVASAVDALAHAVESYVSRLASPFTRMHSQKAVELFIKYIKPAATDRDPHALEQLSIASTSAGMAFSNASLGILHALAHSLGGIYDVLHGLVHPVLLTPVMRYNMSACPEAMGAIGRMIAGSGKASDRDAALEGIATLESLFEELGVTTRLRELIPDDSKLEAICKMAVKDACYVSNPREADWTDLMSICREAW